MLWIGSSGKKKDGGLDGCGLEAIPVPVLAECTRSSKNDCRLTRKFSIHNSTLDRAAMAALDQSSCSCTVYSLAVGGLQPGKPGDLKKSVSRLRFLPLAAFFLKR
jgi:hypothetical protein